MDFYACLVQLHQLGVVPIYNEAQVDLLVLDDPPKVLVKLATTNPAIQGLGAFEVLATEGIITLPAGCHERFSTRRERKMEWTKEDVQLAFRSSLSCWTDR